MAARFRRGLGWSAALTALAGGAIAAIPNLDDLEERLRSAHAGWVAAAIGLEVLSCVAFVATFRLVFPSVERRLARRVAWIEMAFGAAVPLGGAGGLVAGAWILNGRGVPLADVARRSAVLFLLTSAINALVLALAGFGVALGVLPGGDGLATGLIPGIVGAAAIAVFAAVPLVARGGPGRLRRWLSETANVVRETEAALRVPDWRLAAAFGYLLFDIGVLWAAFRAVGAAPGLGTIVVGYQVGYLANLLPIPGSIGVLEGGLVGALVACGAPARETLAAAVIYHATALWVPALGGAARFLGLRRSPAEVA